MEILDENIPQVGPLDRLCRFEWISHPALLAASAVLRQSCKFAVQRKTFDVGAVYAAQAVAYPAGSR